MGTYEILIVEDDEPTIEGWMRDIRDFHRRSDERVRFSPHVARTRREALRELSRVRVDCAVIDLRLPDEVGDGVSGNPYGNDVLEKLLDEVGIPAAVYSGYEGEASESVRSSRISVFTKEGGAPQRILDLFASQADLMDAMELVRRRIARETARLFNGSIWHRWEAKWSKEFDRLLIEGIIARQTAAHIAESLAQAPTKHHPDEFYVVPPLYPDRFDTGDLIDVKDETLVVLTPRCNMANKPPSQVMLALCRKLEPWSDWGTSLLGSKAKQEKATKAIEAHATQGHEIASHFLPPLDGRGPWLVDFKEVRTMKSEELGGLLQKRIASIAPQFVPNLVQRYAAYLGRIGQPDIDANLLMESCKSAVGDKQGGHNGPDLGGS